MKELKLEEQIQRIGRSKPLLKDNSKLVPLAAVVAVLAVVSLVGWFVL